MKDQSPDIAERLSIRERPTGSPIMYQSSGKLLIMHFRYDVWHRSDAGTCPEVIKAATAAAGSKLMTGIW